MDRDQIALDFIRVYKEYKERTFLSRKLKGEKKGEPIKIPNKRKQGRIGDINPE